jgi:ADP-dependent phosphofructokinase/glucokinase
MGLVARLWARVRRGKTPEQVLADADARRAQREFELSKARYRGR